jgi:hypothetical protein
MATNNFNNQLSNTVSHDIIVMIATTKQNKGP